MSAWHLYKVCRAVPGTFRPLEAPLDVKWWNEGLAGSIARCLTAEMSGNVLSPPFFDAVA